MKCLCNRCVCLLTVYKYRFLPISTFLIPQVPIILPRKEVTLYIRLRGAISHIPEEVTLLLDSAPQVEQVSIVEHYCRLHVLRAQHEVVPLILPGVSMVVQVEG